MTTKTVELTNTMRRLGNEYRAFFGHTWKYDGAEIVYVKGYFQIRKNGETLATSNHADVLHNHMVAYARNGTPNMAMLRAGIARSTPVKKKPLEKPEQPLLNGASEVTSMVAPELETPIAAIEVSVAATSPFADGTFGKRYADKVYHYTKDGKVTLCGLKAWAMAKKSDATGVTQSIECEKCRAVRDTFICDDKMPTDGEIWSALEKSGFLTTTKKEGVMRARASIYADMPTITVPSARAVLIRQVRKVVEGLGEGMILKIDEMDSDNGLGILIMTIIKGKDLIDRRPEPNTLPATNTPISSDLAAKGIKTIWTIQDQHEIGRALIRYGHSMGIDKENPERLIVSALDRKDVGEIEGILYSLHMGTWQVMKWSETIFHLNKVMPRPKIADPESPSPESDPSSARIICDQAPRTDNERKGNPSPIRGGQMHKSRQITLPVLICIECGKNFSAKRKDAKTCGATCRKRYQRRKDDLQKDYNTVMNTLTRLSMLGRKYADLYETIRESLITFGSEIRAIQADLHNRHSGAE